jgi:chemotaxis methyl-accepting protein methylase
MLTDTNLTFRRLGRAYLSLNSRIWRRLPAAARRLAFVRLYGAHVHFLVRRLQPRTQNHSTYFFRNRAELELLKRLAQRREISSEFRIAVLGCSKGAEVYSIVYTIRSARPDLKLRVKAVDISQEILEFAEAGVYSLAKHEPTPIGNAQGDPTVHSAAMTFKDQFKISIFDRTTEAELNAMFEMGDCQARVKDWLKEGISWIRGDVTDSGFLDSLGPQDLVVANRFLCHMEPPFAERCLSTIARLAKPGGYFFVSGVDLDVRAKVARRLAWRPVTELMQAIYEGDPSLTNDWPLAYWASEPFRPKRHDSRLRYAAAFQVCAKALPVMSWFRVWDYFDRLTLRW